MSADRIGTMLRRIARLSDLDVEEILQEQALNPQRFGEAAMSLGKCKPADVWRTWFQQLAYQTPSVDLAEFGVDTQAIALVPRDLAMQFQLLPLRAMGIQVVAAIADGSAIPPVAEISQRLKKEIRFVRATTQIQAAINTHYGALRTSA